MERLKGSCIIGQSGGPSAVINASIWGAIELALDSPDITKVYGARHGIVGVIKGELYDLSQEDRDELALLKTTPSAALGSCRYKLGDEADFAKILETFKRYDVRYFFYNGGNDSMDTCSRIAQYMKEHDYDCRIIGIPKTIDNDLWGTDHCPGYGSAAKYIATSMMELYHDAHVYDTTSVVICEVMGRNAGWLTGAAAAACEREAGPDLIYLPEMPFSLEQFSRDVKAVVDRKKVALVAISEGIKNERGEYILEELSHANKAIDPFGHIQLGGIGVALAEYIRQKLIVKVRPIELSLLQRCAAHMASHTDVESAYRAGRAACGAALDGVSEKMIGFTRSGEPGNVTFDITHVDLGKVANTEKMVPREWINASGNGVTKEFLDYVRPLIAGESRPPFEHGLPRFAKLRKVLAR